MKDRQPPNPKAPIDFTLNLDKMVKFEPIKIDTRFFESLEKIAEGVALFQANMAKIAKPLLIGFAEAFTHWGIVGSRASQNLVRD